MLRIWTLALAVALVPARAETEFHWQLACGRAGALATAAGEERQYAPDRRADFLHVTLDVTPDFERETVEGSTTIRFRPIAFPMEELRLNAVKLTVRSVAASHEVAAHVNTDEEIIVRFKEPIPPDTEAWITVEHSAHPEKGLYFRTPSTGYDAEETHLFTQGEPLEARHWYPCHDYPNEKFTTEIICHLPPGMVALSNGEFIAQEQDAETGLVRFHWLQDKPHVNYLVTLVAGYFETIEDQYGPISLTFHTPPPDIGLADNSFRGTREMMGFFEDEIGVAYPWAKYGQVVVRGFMWGGMENTSLTTLSDRTLYPDELEETRSSRGLVAHELAHQWFGNLITCKDWSHIWLNEGFATYYEKLQDGHQNGRDAMLYSLYQLARSLTSNPNDPRAIVYRGYDEPDSMFRQRGHLVYGKGAWVLHMLRSQLGADVFRRAVREYVRRYQFGTAVTQDLASVLEEVSGRSFDQFFDQWVYHGGAPELKIGYSWDASSQLAKLSVAQTQKVGDGILLFQFPLPIRFQVGDQTIDHSITVDQAEEDFYFPLAAAPELIRIDPNLTVLAKVDFSPPGEMLFRQLTNQVDVVGRLIAADQLGEKKDRRSVESLTAVLQNDPFYGVRVAAARALRRIDSNESRAALLASTAQPDARVRRELFDEWGRLYSEGAMKAALAVVEREKNGDALAEAIASLGAYHRPVIRKTLLDQLDSTSYKNLLADAAIEAMRVQDQPYYIKPLLACLAEDEDQFTVRGFASALETLGFLARHQRNKTEVRSFIASFVESRKEPIQAAALSALGTLSDPSALAVVLRFTDGPEASPVRKAAEAAAAQLRAERPPSVELRDLRQEVTDLQQSNQRLASELEDLKKKFDALDSKEEKPEG